MVWTDPISQDPYALQRLSAALQVPILAIHAPCLIITQRVWTTDPWIKLQKAQFAAELLGAQTVVVHPPFRWQRDYARDFREGIARHGRRDRRAVRGREHVPAAGARPRGVGLPADMGRRRRRRAVPRLHPGPVAPAVSQSDALAMLDAMGERLRHLHIADGTGVAKRRAPRSPAAATSRAPRCSNASPRAASTAT